MISQICKIQDQRNRDPFLSRFHDSILLFKGSFPHIRKIVSGSRGKRRSDIEGSRDGLSEIDSMHQKCSGHIHRAPKSRDLKDSTPARSSFSGKRCFFLRQMREICLAAEFREARSRFPDEYFRFQYLQRCGNRIFDRGTYIHLRHHVSTRRCETRSTMMRLFT